MTSEITTPSSSVKATASLRGQEHFVIQIARELGLSESHVRVTAGLLADGGTVPFIARYRKEATGSLDEVQIAAIRDRLNQLAELEKRREAILKSLDERKLLTDALREKVLGAKTLTALEDVFAPYRPKRRTRATMAKDRGLEPLADWLFTHQVSNDSSTKAEEFLVKSEDKDKAVPTVDDALSGARDILAERFSDDPEARKLIRKRYESEAILSSKVITGQDQDPGAAKFRDYFEWSEPLSKVPSHRLLAMRRGEKEGHLLLRIRIEEEQAIGLLQRLFVTDNGLAGRQVALACEDSFKRLLSASLETEARLTGKKQADEQAIQVFGENIRELLMAAPLGQKSVLAMDPGFRTGCKVVVLDAQGKLLHDEVVFATGNSASQVARAREQMLTMVDRFKVEAIAIGNGTGSRETEAFVRSCGLSTAISVVVVNESGASIYSASEVAREEFPDKDLTVRGAVSIGRRLMDPLAELVKLKPKSIGVGQYQHDVDQRLLKEKLSDVVVSSVNRVGVEVNTASRQLLSYVAGLNDTIAGNIVDYRNEKGPLKSRAELKKVSRLGPKAFEQAAGFLRIGQAKNPLDSSGVHPESYEVVKRMAADLQCQVRDLVEKGNLRQQVQLEQYVDERVGLPTLTDIMEELAKPGRDPRERFEAFSFDPNVEKPADLKLGMKLPGIVTNVTAFGAFVDVGVHQDGLVHVSQLSDDFVSDPATVVKVGQKVKVTVVEVDLARNRIGLSCKTNPEIGARSQSGHDRKRSDHPRGPRASRPPREQRSFGGGSLADAFDQALKKKP